MAKVDAVDGTLFKFMHRYANKPQNRAVVQAVEAYTAKAKGPVHVADVQKVAVQAAKDELIREGDKHPSADTIKARAYWGAAIAAEEKPFMIAEDTQALSKSVHYFATGAIAARVASWLPFLPSGVRHFLGFHVAQGIGVLKEIADKIKGTGFNRRDIAIDEAGARAALKN